ncbi:DUF4350 domain-containing protein [Lewinella sp. JB7]|uniref:DUF4350 domain-containing protein n=1 Tax=Lewinella sp. JB7 TaxID=2962887 RepID=UPI0020C9A0A2|nr:DUF4350 domain-containing protein [Lewinella sp. JB7]MCP9234518.1 hypothetical protein [Lewinella sp. JB7]
MTTPLLLRYLIAGWALLSLFGCPSVNWSESYRYDERNPFDLYALHELLAARPEGMVRLQDSIDFRQLDSVAATNYLFVGHWPFYREEAVTGLLNYVERGNTAFLAVSELPEDLAYHLFGDDCYYERFGEASYAGQDRFPTVIADSVTAYRYPDGAAFDLVNVRFWRPTPTPLHVIDERLLCDSTLDNRVLGVLDTFGVNFIRVGWGAGDFYVHSNPVFFTNWFLLDSLQYRYAEAMLSVIAEGPVYWDEHHRRYRRDPGTVGSRQAASRNYDGGRNLLDGNPTLLYVQERRELAFAWYTLLAGAILYVLFRGRRRQRVIPPLPARTNDSRRFIDTVSRLLYRRGDHAALARRELASLRQHLNHRLGIHWLEGHPPPADLARRSGLPAAVIEQALTQIRVVTAGKRLRDGDLLRFYRAIEPLYGPWATGS